MNPRTRNRLILIGIVVLFFGPVLLALLMRSAWWDYRPGATVNRGQLVEPPVTLALGDLPSATAHEAGRKSTWSMLYRLPQACDARCLEDITSLRQIHIASGRHRTELDAVLLSNTEPTKEQLDAWLRIYPDFHVRVFEHKEDREALDRLQSTGDGAAGFTYVVDPAGNVILAYPPRLNPADLNKDLKRLLKWSGERGA